jgi:hypothetical protein
MIEQIQNKVMNFIDDKEDITEINYLETEANSEDEYIDKHDLSMVLKGKNNRLNTKTESSETNDNGAVSETSKMYHFGLHNVNDDLFNTLKKDKKIVSILSELNSNNTKKDISLDEMSSDIEQEKVNNIKFTSNKFNNSDDDSDDSDDSDNMNGSDTSSDVKISSLRR